MKCPDCGGAKKKGFPPAKDCETCNGSGKVPAPNPLTSQQRIAAVEKVIQSGPFTKTTVHPVPETD